MATSKSKGGIGSLRAGRVVRRLILPIALVCFLALYLCFGFLRVPQGMDTMPDVYPPGTTCLIQRHPTSVVANKSIVFLEVESGAAPLLVRVLKFENGRIYPFVENPQSRFAAYAEESYPFDKVRSLVLTGVIPDSAVPVPTRGK